LSSTPVISRESQVIGATVARTRPGVKRKGHPETSIRIQLVQVRLPIAFALLDSQHRRTAIQKRSKISGGGPSESSSYMPISAHAAVSSSPRRFSSGSLLSWVTLNLTHVVLANILRSTNG